MILDIYQHEVAEQKNFIFFPKAFKGIVPLLGKYANLLSVLEKM